MNKKEIEKLFKSQVSDAMKKYPDIREYLSDRSIGIISKSELELIRKTSIAILGIGGIGMPLLELLVRCGAEKLTIVDNDIVDPTNLNRLPLAFPFTFGCSKIELAAFYMKLINPNIEIRKFETLTSQNVSEVLEGVEVVALTLDGLYSSLVTAKYCRKNLIPFIEGWALAGILNARIFKPEGPSYEEIYNLNIHKNYDNLTEGDIEKLEKEFLVSISKISQDTTQHYDSEGLRLMMEGAPRRSFAPFVWIISSIICSELIFKLVLKRNLPNKIAPNILLYDYLRYIDLEKKGQRKLIRKQIHEILVKENPLKSKINAIIKIFLG